MDDLDNEEIIIPDKFTCTKKGYKYFVDYKSNALLLR